MSFTATSDPENILVVTGESTGEYGRVPPDSSIHLVDFETARRIDGPENRPGARVVGKPPYMAPELARGEPLSPKTDLYALGVIFYEMLTGEQPSRPRAARRRPRSRCVDPPDPPASGGASARRRLGTPDADAGPRPAGGHGVGGAT